MNRSDSIAALAGALAKAQGAMEGAKKDASNPFFNSRYADLASVWDACRGPLSANALAVVQISLESATPGNVAVETLLMHSSGEWISGVLEMKPVKTDPQGIGSALTYARRYGLMAMIGIAPEDDDGNAASQPNKQLKEARPPAQPRPAPVEAGGFDIDSEIRKGLSATGIKDGQLTKWAHDTLGTTAAWPKLGQDEKVQCFNYLKDVADGRAA